MSEALNVKVNGEWVGIPAIQDKIITVESYGAKGDGVTDDTLAIQTCITENPSSHIYFKGGTYLISDTLHIYNASAGQFIDLGGSILKFGGTSTTDQPMIITDKTGSKSANTIIANGTIDGDRKIDILVQNTTFYTTITNLRLINFNHIGILTGSLTDTYDDVISAECWYDNLTITNIKGDHSESDKTIGMYFTNPDNFASNIHASFVKTGILCRCGGCYFDNIHYTYEWSSSYLTSKGGVMDSNNFKGETLMLKPYNADMSETVTLNNCYFNAGKYVVNCEEEFHSRMNVKINNSNYTFYSSVDKLPDNSFAAIFGGNYTYFYNADNFGSEHSSKLTLLKHSFAHFNYAQMTCSQVNVHYDNIIKSPTIFDAKCGGRTTEYNHNSTIGANSAVKIGAVLKSMDIANSNRQPVITFTFESSTGTRICRFYRDNGAWAVTGDSNGRFKFYIDKTPTTINLDGLTYYYYNIYYYNNGAAITTDVYVRMESNFASSEVYSYRINSTTSANLLSDGAVDTTKYFAIM